MAIFIWDDGYGISVPKKYQTTKASISQALGGMQKEDGTSYVALFNTEPPQKVRFFAQVQRVLTTYPVGE